MAIFKSDMTMIKILLKSLKKLIQWWRDYAKRIIPSKVMSDFANWFRKVLILQYKNGMLAKKLSTRFLVLQSKKNHQESTPQKRIRPIPVDLGILCHIVYI